MQIRKLIMLELFPYLKLNDKNLTLFKKINIYSTIIVQLFIIIWVSLYFILPKLFNFTLKYNNITIHSKTKIKDSLDAYFRKPIDYLKNDTLYIKNKHINIFFLNDSLMYTFLNPIEWLPNRQTYAVTQNSRIHIKHVDLKHQLVYIKSKNNYPENLSSIFIHEALHVYQNEKYGWFYTSFMMPYWVKEGYPIYKSDRFSNFSMSKLKKILQKNPNKLEDLSTFSKDRLYALMVKHAIEKMHKSVDDLHLGKIAYNKVLKSLLKNSIPKIIAKKQGKYLTCLHSLKK